MGRLINESNVIEIAEKCTFTDENEKKKILDFVRYCVKEAKTAYDVEKVVEEINNEENWCNAEEMIHVEVVEEIVRKGGV